MYGWANGTLFACSPWFLVLEKLIYVHPGPMLASLEVSFLLMGHGDVAGEVRLTEPQACGVLP